jgi:hypothetical protein
MLYREPICVLVLCTDQTSKALQIQQVVAVTGETFMDETDPDRPSRFSSSKATSLRAPDGRGTIGAAEPIDVAKVAGNRLRDPHAF